MKKYLEKVLQLLKKFKEAREKNMVVDALAKEALAN